MFKNDPDFIDTDIRQENEKMKRVLQNVVDLIEENNYETKEGLVNVNKHQLTDFQISVAATITPEFS